MTTKTFAELRNGEAFRFPGCRRFLVKIADGFKNVEGGALHQCSGDAEVEA